MRLNEKGKGRAKRDTPLVKKAAQLAEREDALLTRERILAEKKKAANDMPKKMWETGNAGRQDTQPSLERVVRFDMSAIPWSIFGI